ncbi:hypothetical protein QEN19_001600 [Hanseniaspora menglaensis]
MYTTGPDGKRQYTLKKISDEGEVTKSAHPARFSPDDKFSRERLFSYITVPNSLQRLIMKESENIEIHGRSFVIKWINLLEYTDNQNFDVNESPTLNFNFRVKPLKRTTKFGLFTKRHGLVSAGNTFDTSVNNNNGGTRNYRSIFRHTNSSSGSLSNGNVSNTLLSSSPPLSHAITSQSITTPSSIKKEKKISLKEKLNKSNMKNILPLVEIKNNKSLTKNVTISLDQPLYLALVFDNEQNLRKNKVELSFEISTSNVELTLTSASNLTSDFKSGNFKQQGDNFNTLETNSSSYIQGTPPLANKELFDSALLNFQQPGQITSPANSVVPLQRYRRPSMVALNKRSFYIEDNTVFQGYVPKNRRNPTSNKQFVTRFFVLDLRSGTLTYYQNNNTKNVKGEVLLKTCVVSADPQRGEIVIDSGFEIWILKPYSWDYDPWLDALGKCIIEETYLEKEKLFKFENLSAADITSLQTSLSEIKVLTAEAKALTTDQSLVSIFDKILSIVEHPKKIIMEKSFSSLKGSSESLCADLYSSVSMDEYYDAIDEIPRVIMIKPETDETELIDTRLESDEDENDDQSEEFTSSSNVTSPVQTKFGLTSSEDSETSYPLPHHQVIRRCDIAAPTKNPPSLLSFLRKNVGKDLGSISMPVTSNEPLTILQFLAESLEYSSILNDCLETFGHPNTSLFDVQRKRHALVSAFALSQLSQQRSKIRCLRKPFNPLLGETFELVNEIDNYKFIAEKVEHKPEQVFAVNAQGFGCSEIKNDNGFKWEISYTVQPSSKFWGKSIELMNYGTLFLKFKNIATGLVIETYTWTAPVTILKNLIAGERFVEPTGEVEINCLETKLKTVFEFKSAGGFFKGRNEQAKGVLYDAKGKKTGHFDGLWTSHLTLFPENETIWKAGALKSNADNKYGFSEFACNLNEITAIEEGFIPKTDSRLRPDVRYYENGNIDKAEEHKLMLEFDQRERRMNKQDVLPLYFKKINSSEYTFINGNDSYWGKRERGAWEAVPSLW